MINYYKKEDAIKNILAEVETKKNAYIKALKTRRYLADFMRSIPDEFFPKLNYLSTSVYTYSDMCNISLDFPWDLTLMKEVKNFLKEHSDNVSESDYDDKSRTLLYASIDLDNGYKLEINVTFSVSVEGSTCILVPLETHEETKTVVDLYDRVCPEGHPELFEERDGQLVYIGDAFAPAKEIKNG